MPDAGPIVFKKPEHCDSRANICFSRQFVVGLLIASWCWLESLMKQVVQLSPIPHPILFTQYSYSPPTQTPQTPSTRAPINPFCPRQITKSPHTIYSLLLPLRVLCPRALQAKTPQLALLESQEKHTQWAAGLGAITLQEA